MSKETDIEVLLKKSKENEKATKLLIENKIFNSSIHCLYYSLFQLIKYKCYKKNANFEAQAKGSHNMTWKYFLKQYVQNDDNNKKLYK